MRKLLFGLLLLLSLAQTQASKLDVLYHIAEPLTEHCSYYGEVVSNNHIHVQWMNCMDGSKRIVVFNTDTMTFCRTGLHENTCSDFYSLIIN